MEVHPRIKRGISRFAGKRINGFLMNQIGANGEFCNLNEFPRQFTKLLPYFSAHVGELL